MHLRETLICSGTHYAKLARDLKLNEGIHEDVIYALYQAALGKNLRDILVHEDFERLAGVTAVIRHTLTQDEVLRDIDSKMHEIHDRLPHLNRILAFQSLR